MTSFLYGMLGAVVVDAVFLVAFLLAAPRLLRAAMKRGMAQAFGKKPAGMALASQYATDAEKAAP